MDDLPFEGVEHGVPRRFEILFIVHVPYEEVGQGTLVQNKNH